MRERGGMNRERRERKINSRNNERGIGKEGERRERETKSRDNVRRRGRGGEI